MSAVAHALALLALLWMPSREPAALPGVVTVDLVAGIAPAAAAPVARAAAPSAAKPVPPAPKPVEPKPVPAPVVAQPEPPKPQPPKPTPAPPQRAEAVIPKKPEREPEKPKAKPEPEPEPKPDPPKQVAKAAPPTLPAPVTAKPEPSPPAPAAAKPEPPPPAPPKPAPPKQESYDDLLADLRAERGEARPERVDRPTRAASAATAAAASGAGRPGAAASPEIAGWVRAVQIHVGQAWMLPPDMRGRRLMTELLVDLDARGRVLSEPRVVRSSGDARFDENAVRAIQKASPLPAPPDEGVWTIGFCPECRSG